jgi:DNA end-binding protein Ku
MAARASWKGYLKLSLVSCPVQLFPATTRANRISFNTLNRKTSNRVQMKYHDAETGEVVEREEQVKGYEFDKGRYVVVEKEELDALKIDSSRTIDIERFVGKADIDIVYYESPYYLAPDGAVAEEAFRVIRVAMDKQAVVGIGRLSIAGRENVVAVEPREKGMMVTTLRAADEVRRAGDAFEGIGNGEVDEEMVALAEQIIKKKAGPFDPAMFEDRYQAALLDLVKAKMKGQKPVVPKVVEPGKVIDLMAALKKSVSASMAADGEGKPRAASRKRASAPPAASGRGEAAQAPASGRGRGRKAG